MNFILGLIQLLTIGSVAIYEYKNGSLSMYLWATLLVMFGIPHFVATLTEIYIFPQDVYIQASLFVIIFNGLYFMFRFMMKKFVKSTTIINRLRINVNGYYHEFLENNGSRRLSITLAVFFILSLYSLVLNYGSIFNTSWGQLYNESTNAYSLGFNLNTIRFFSNNIMIISGGLIPYYFFNKELKKSILVGIIIFVFGLITRNRILILPFVVSTLVLAIVKNKKINIKNIIIYSLLGFSAIYLVYALRLFRHYGTLSTFLNTVNLSTFNERVFEMLLNGDGELGLRNVFLYFINNDNNFPGFNKGHTYIRLLFVLIPTRFAFGLKPSDFAITMGSAWRGDFSNSTFSTHPTLYGDVFANLFWAGIFLAIFWAIFVTVIDWISYKKRSRIEQFCNISIFGTMYIIIGRGSVYNAVFSAIVSVVILRLLMLVFRKVPRVKL